MATESTPRLPRSDPLPRSAFGLVIDLQFVVVDCLAELTHQGQLLRAVIDLSRGRRTRCPRRSPWRCTSPHPLAATRCSHPRHRQGTARSRCWPRHRGSPHRWGTVCAPTEGSCLGRLPCLPTRRLRPPSAIANSSPPETGKGHLGAQRLFEAGSDLLQQPVAVVVTESVVDLLEPIQIHEHHCELLARRPSCNGLAHRGVERHAIRQDRSAHRASASCSEPFDQSRAVERHRGMIHQSLEQPQVVLVEGRDIALPISHHHRAAPIATLVSEGNDQNIFVPQCGQLGSHRLVFRGTRRTNAVTRCRMPPSTADPDPPSLRAVRQTHPRLRDSAHNHFRCENPVLDHHQLCRSRSHDIPGRRENRNDRVLARCQILKQVRELVETLQIRIALAQRAREPEKR